MTTALEGGEWSAARPGRTLPSGKTQYPLYRRLGGPQGRSGRAENLVITGIRCRTVQPLAFNDILQVNTKGISCLKNWFSGIFLSITKIPSTEVQIQSRICFPKTPLQRSRVGLMQCLLSRVTPALQWSVPKGELVESDKVKFPNGSFALVEPVERCWEERISHTTNRANILVATQFLVGKHLFRVIILLYCWSCGCWMFQTWPLTEMPKRVQHLRNCPSFKHFPLSNYTEKSSTWEANSSSASLEIPRIVWNPNVHCSTHKSSNTCPCPVPHQSSQGPHPIS